MASAALRPDNPLKIVLRQTQDGLSPNAKTGSYVLTIPIIIYNMPACTGIDLRAETIAAMAEHPNVTGLKESGGNVVKNDWHCPYICATSQQWEM